MRGAVFLPSGERVKGGATRALWQLWAKLVDSEVKGGSEDGGWKAEEDEGRGVCWQDQEMHTLSASGGLKTHLTPAKHA